MNASNAQSAPEKFRAGLTLDLLRTTWMEWQEDKAPRLGAAFAYYTIFSIAPLLIVVIAVAASVLGEAAAGDKIREQLQDTIGRDAAKTVQDMIEATSKARGTGIWASIVGLLVSLWGASNLFGQLQDSLNTIWEVTPKPSEGVWNVVRQRFLSFGMVLAVGFVLLVSFVASAAVTAFGDFVSGWVGIPPFALQSLNLGISLLTSTLFFACVFKVLPDARVQWRDVWIGALLTAVLFGIGRYALGKYLGSGNVASAYGAAGSLVVLLLWVYYAAQILFFGAEFTQVFANRFGSKVRPSAHAMPVTEAMREQEGIPRLGDLQAQEVAHSAAKRGAPIRNASEPLSNAPSTKTGAKSPLQILARGSQSPKSGKPRLEKADREYLLGAAVGFAAILMIALRREKRD